MVSYHSFFCSIAILLSAEGGVREGGQEGEGRREEGGGRSEEGGVRREGEEGW